MQDAKPARRKIKTVGDLRALLSEAIESVMAGDLDPHRATALVKLATAVNASLLAEIEVARFSLVQTNKFEPLGSLVIAGQTTEAPTTIEAKPEEDAEHSSETEPRDEPNAACPPPPPPSAAIALASASNAMRAAKTSRVSALAPRIIDHRPSGTFELPGTPAPGRSALDRRNEGTRP